MKIILKAKENINGIMDVNLMVNGKVIRWKVMGSFRGQMVEDMKAIILMIRKKEQESFIGLMVDYMKDNGRTVINMGKVSILFKMGKQEKGNG